jgi:hypothetical protein
MDVSAAAVHAAPPAPKAYATAGEARRYATAFDREDRQDIGRRAPLVAGLPLRLARARSAGVASPR